MICAGAGMGVDSGLPDYRGVEGFWRAYPPLAERGIRFEQIAQPQSFAEDPVLAWGFYGHCLDLYRTTLPHDGFRMLLRWAAAKPRGYFVFTSNVDGQFERAGFNPQRIAECHGSIHHWQCTEVCDRAIRPADVSGVEVEAKTLRAAEPLPRCPTCGRLARPNVLLFDDDKWASARTDAQEVRLRAWLDGVRNSGARVAVIECGAGRAVQTVRWLSDLQTAFGATLIRINPRDCHVPAGSIAIPLGALEALYRIDAELSGR